MPGERQIVESAEISENVVSEIISRTFRSIPRSDQRRWGELYVRGLLSVSGRKTMRAIADGAGGGVEQSLYQFITKSPWAAEPVRRELADLLLRLEPRAWVVHPLVISKVGRHSVGVERRWVSSHGRVVNCQQAIGVWLAGDRASCPVDWRLALPESWAGEASLRRRACIPEDIGSCPPEQCAVQSVSAMAGDWGLPHRPVVMDLRESDAYAVCAALLERRVPFVVRIDPAARGLAMRPVRPSVRPGGTERFSEDTGAPCPPGSALALVPELSRQCLPVEWYDHEADALRATSVGAARVLLRRTGPDAPRPLPADQQELILVGAWRDPGRRTPSAYWLSNLPQSQLGTVYRTAMLAHRVTRDLAEVGEGLGIRDFEGRSFRGWHHHMTMVSLAHAATVLSGAQRPGTWPPAVRMPAPRERMGVRAA
ncbi:transposase [Streptomyces collinus]|uniref:IS701 family transposase n=1 Tax=Streptomyces collinus TaxID=42684 RepID=UPI002943E625|nr:transposase [Streptomyces collinus]